MKKYSIFSLIAGLAVAQFTLLTAQDQRPADAGGPQRARRLERLERRERPAAEGQAAEGLTEEQRQKVRDVMEKFREDQRVAFDKLRTARTELDEASRGEQVDEAKIRAKAQVVGQIEGDLAILRAKQFAELRKVLPKEQVDRMQQPGAPGGGRFGPAGGGAAVGGGRPGRPDPQPPATPPSPVTQPK